MRAKYKRKWVRALRSGKFLQGNGALKSITKATEETDEGIFLHCCLGVLCEIVADDLGLSDKEREKWGSLKTLKRKYGEGEKTYTFDGEAGTLPDRVVQLVNTKADYKKYMDEDQEYINLPGFLTSEGEFVLKKKNKKGELEHRTLANLNDKGNSFKQIALYIERYF